MKSITLLSALVGVASAHLPAQLPREAEDISDDCREVRESISSANRPEATVLSELSLSYYKTASRTATLSILDCAWITEVPESVYTDVAEYVDADIEWTNSPGNLDLIFERIDKCANASDVTEISNLDDIDLPICKDEWATLFDEMKEKTGWVPVVLDPQAANDTDAHDRTDTDDADLNNANPNGMDTPEDSMATPGFQASAVAALLATLLGFVAIL